MGLKIGELVVDCDGSLVTVKSISTMRDKKTMEILSVTLEVVESSRVYSLGELMPREAL
jgi:hypothetical protein